MNKNRDKSSENFTPLPSIGISQVTRVSKPRKMTGGKGTPISGSFKSSKGGKANPKVIDAEIVFVSKPLPTRSLKPVAPTSRSVAVGGVVGAGAVTALPSKSQGGGGQLSIGNTGILPGVLPYIDPGITLPDIDRTPDPKPVPEEPVVTSIIIGGPPKSDPGNTPVEDGGMSIGSTSTGDDGKTTGRGKSYVAVSQPKRTKPKRTRVHDDDELRKKKGKKAKKSHKSQTRRVKNPLPWLESAEIGEGTTTAKAAVKGKAAVRTKAAVKGKTAVRIKAAVKGKTAVRIKAAVKSKTAVRTKASVKGKTAVRTKASVKSKTAVRTKASVKGKTAVRTKASVRRR